VSSCINKIVIVGGGTAGWLTAGIIASHHKTNINKKIKIVLIESDDIATVGVGEGTWPTMKNTLNKIGIKESDIFYHCHAAFKQGGKFVNWKKSPTNSNNDFYYHPFTVPLGYGQLDLAPYVSCIENFAVESNYQQAICEAGLAPKTLSELAYQGQCNYAYHIDAGALGELLKNHCKANLSVEHIIGNVDQAQLTADGFIHSVCLTGQGKVTGDLFIDCTGSTSFLLGKTLAVPFIKVDNILFNDSALAVHVPYDENEAPMACHTIATGQNAGWIWDIGLSNRRGVGHVYASNFLNDDDAENNLRSYLGDSKENLSIRKIHFESGYRECFWKNNCVAVGMSAGFVEPLEATAIMLIELSGRYIAENLPADNKTMAITSKRFNQQMNYRWQRIIDFLKLHYFLSERNEPYWKAHRESYSLSESLLEDLAIWKYRGPVSSDFESTIELFPAASYQYVLYGMGFKPNFDSQPYLYDERSKADKIIQRNHQLTEQMLQHLPPHRDFIKRWLADSYDNKKV